MSPKEDVDAVALRRAQRYRAEVVLDLDLRAQFLGERPYEILEAHVVRLSLPGIDTANLRRNGPPVSIFVPICFAAEWRRETSDEMRCGRRTRIWSR